MVSHKWSLVLGGLLVVLALRCGGTTQPTLPPPVITRFSAARSLITAGESTTLTADFSYGQGVIDQGVGPVLDDRPVTITPARTTTYTLVDSDVSGDRAESQVTVTVVPVPAEPVIQPPDSVEPGQKGLTASVAAQDGCTYRWTLNPKGGTITAGADQPTVTFDTAAFGTLTLSCTVTNAAGRKVRSATLSFPLGGPTVASFSADPATITEGDGSVLAFSFSGGTAVLSTPGAPDQTLGGTETSLTVTPAATTTYTLPVTASTGQASSEAVPVTVVPAPVIRTFSAGSGIIGTGASAHLIARFEAGPGGKASVDQGVGPVGNQVPAATGTLEHTTVFTLTVANAAGREVTAQAKVRVGSLATLAGVPSGEGSADGSAARYRSPSGMVQDEAGNTLVADTQSHTIRKIALGGAVTTLAGEEGQAGSADGTGTAARFDLPVGLALDPGGNLLVADSGNGAIRQVNPGGAVTTLATGLHGPTGVAVGQDGGGTVIFVADTGSATIRKIQGGAVSILAGSENETGNQDGDAESATFNAPAGLAWNGTDRLYVADAGNNSIRQVGLDGSVATLAGDAEGFKGPQGLAIDMENQILYVADTGNSTVRGVDLDDGSVSPVAGDPGVTGASNAPALFNRPQGLALAAAGRLLVAATGNATIRAITHAGVSTLSGQPPAEGSGNGSAGEFRHPRGLALNPANGELFVADQDNRSIRRVAPGGTVDTLGGAEFSRPAGVALDGAGHVLVADAGDHTVRRIAADGTVTLVAGQPGESGSADSAGAGSAGARFDRPVALAVDGAGNVLVADQGNHAIRRIQPDGTVSTLSTAFKAPAAVALAMDGRTLYVADMGDATVLILVDGRTSVLAGSPGQPGSVDGTGSEARLNEPCAIALDGAGTLFVANNGSSTLCAITPAGVVTTVVGSPVQSGTVPGPLPAQLAPPWGLVVAPATGNIYVTVDDAVMEVDFTK